MLLLFCVAFYLFFVCFFGVFFAPVPRYRTGHTLSDFDVILWPFPQRMGYVHESSINLIAANVQQFCIRVSQISSPHINAPTGCLLYFQVRHLYRRVLQKLPLCASLWKDVMFPTYHSFKCSIIEILYNRIAVKIELLINFVVCKRDCTDFCKSIHFHWQGNI